MTQQGFQAFAYKNFLLLKFFFWPE